MSRHDWRHWTPAMVPNSARWGLVCYATEDGRGKATWSHTPSGALRTFESERRAQLAANWLNEHPEGAADA